MSLEDTHPDPRLNRIVIGIVGGIASGKSIATQTMADLGGFPLFADKIAHAILSEPSVVRDIVRAFNSDVLCDDGLKLDRKKIAKQVFGESSDHTQRRVKLESIVQPRIRDELRKQIDAWHLAPIGNALILDIPLLYERNWDRECNEVLMIDTPLKLRQELAAKRGWSKVELERREESQMSIEEKSSRATHVIPNSGSEQDLRDQVSKWYKEILARSPN